MLSRAASTLAKTAARRMRRGPSSTTNTTFQRRTMGGGGHAMEGSPAIMENAAEAFGVIVWLWVFSRARADLPWLLGFRHPWDHAPDPFAPSSHDHGHGHGGHGGESGGDLVASWDKFTMKSIKPGEDDDDDDDDDDEDDEDEDDDDDDDE